MSDQSSERTKSELKPKKDEGGEHTGKDPMSAWVGGAVVLIGLIIAGAGVVLLHVNNSLAWILIIVGLVATAIGAVVLGRASRVEDTDSPDIQPARPLRDS